MLNIYHRLASCIQTCWQQGDCILTAPFSRLSPSRLLLSSRLSFSVVLGRSSAGGIGSGVVVLLVRDANAGPNLGRSKLRFHNLFTTASDNPGRSIAGDPVRVHT